MMTPEEHQKALKEAMKHWDWHARFLKEVCDVPEHELVKFGRIAIDYWMHGAKHQADMRKTEK